MSYSTVYDVRVRYSVDNRAGRSGTQGLTQDVKTLGNEARRTSGIFGRLGVAVAGAFGARAAGKALIGFNATVEDTKNQIAGMLALTRKTDLQVQLGNADRLYGKLQQRAKSLPGTTQEYVNMLGMLTQPLSNAGATLKEMEDLTVNAVVAAKALNTPWEVAARDIDQALRGQYHATDPFSSKLLGGAGYAGEEGRAKFNAMGAGKRMDVVKAALMQKQLTQLAAAQGNTFNGQLSTLQDTVEQFLGKVGLPLFRAITAELKRWNSWIDANSTKVDEIASKVGQGLVEGFRYVKDVLTFLVDHREMLMTMGKVWLAVKVGQGVGQGVAGARSLLGAGGGNDGTGLKGLIGFFRGSRDTFNKETGEYEFTKAGRGRQAVGGLKGAADNAGMLGTSLAVGYTIGTMLNDAGMRDFTRSLVGAAEVNGKVYDTSDSITRQFIQLEKSTRFLEDAQRQAAAQFGKATGAQQRLAGASIAAKQQANLVDDYLRAKAKYDKEGGRDNLFWMARHGQDVADAGIDPSNINKAFVDKMRGSATTLDMRNLAAGGGTLLAMTVGVQKLTEYQRKTLETEIAQEQISSYMVQQLAAGKLINPDTIMEIMRRNTQDPEGKHKMADKPKVNVTIQRIEVQSDDPDRMAFGLIESFRDAAKNPSSALSSLREG